MLIGQPNKACKWKYIGTFLSLQSNLQFPFISASSSDMELLHEPFQIQGQDANFCLPKPGNFARFWVEKRWIIKILKSYFLQAFSQRTKLKASKSCNFSSTVLISYRSSYTLICKYVGNPISWALQLRTVKGYNSFSNSCEPPLC